MNASRTTTAALAASLVLALGACKPIDADGKAEAKPGEEKTEATTKIAGLPTEKQQVSYMIGMDMAKSLKPIKDEIDLDTLNKALRAAINGEKLLLTDEQAAQVGQAFGMRLQAKKQAEAEAAVKKNLAEGTTFLAANGKKPGVVTTASGLQYQIVSQGKGPKPKATDTVRVHYKGALLDGTTFDSSYDRKEPVVFALNQVVPGWQEGIQLMPVGSKFKLWIPAALGYGEAGTPGGPIGPNSTLVFDVELLDIVAPGSAPQAQ